MVTARLRASHGGTSSRFEVTPERPVTLGRGSACTIVIQDHTLSRQHCRIAFEGGALVATDLGSANGMLLGEQRVQRVELVLGAPIRVGNTEVVLERIDVVGPAANAPAPAPAATATATATATTPAPTAAASATAASDRALVGTDLGGYRILDVLGSGGAATVFRAEQLQLGREVALKVLRDGSTPEQVAAFVREARAAARLNDPHLVQVFDVGADRGLQFLSMELVHGGSLARVLRKHGPLPWPRALPILRDIAAALRAVHAAGLVHRDVKPANVLLTRAGGAKLADLGLAGGDQHAGTIAFIAPEQLRTADVDARADLYALGCTAWTMLAGTPPFAGSKREMAEAHQRSEPPSLQSLGVRVPPALERFVLEQLMAKDPAARPPSADAVVQTLERIAATSIGDADTDALALQLDDGGDSGAELPASELPPPVPFAPQPRQRPEPEPLFDTALPTPRREPVPSPSPSPRVPREPVGGGSTDLATRLIIVCIVLAVLGTIALYVM